MDCFDQVKVGAMLGMSLGLSAGGFFAIGQSLRSALASFLNIAQLTNQQ